MLRFFPAVILFLTGLSLIHFTSYVYGQTAPNLDNAGSINAERIELLLDKAWELRDSYPDSTFVYARSAESLAENIQNQELIIKAINYQGVAFRNLGNYAMALEKYLLALDLSEAHGVEDQKGYALINIANLNLFQKDYAEAIKYLDLALTQAEALGNQNMMAYSLVNKGRVSREQGKYEEALLYFKSAETIRQELEDEYGLISTRIDIAKVFIHQNENERALQSLEDLVVDIIKINDQRALTTCYHLMAQIHLKLGNVQDGLANARKALSIANDLSLANEELEALITLVDLHALAGNYEEAFRLSHRRDSVNALLFNIEKTREIANLKVQAEMGKIETENQILRLEKERQQAINILLGVIAFLVCLAAIFVYRSLYLKTRYLKKISGQKEVIETQATQLKELNAAQARFFIYITHDLRSPVANTITTLEYIQTDNQSQLSEDGKMLLGHTVSGMKKLTKLIDEIIDVSKLTQGKLTVNKKEINIGIWLNGLIQNFTSVAAEKQIALDLKNDLDSGYHILIDEVLFEKVVNNLISNALRYTSQGGTITIDLKHIEKSLLLGFEDTGSGIHPDDLPHVFERFYQSRHQKLGQIGSLGLGLSMVKEIVELHDGAIEVSSELGQGTRFEIRLPVTPNEEIND